MKDCKGHCCASVEGEHSVACRYEYALARLGLTDTPQMRVLFWNANDALEWKEETDSYVVPDLIQQHDSDCSTNNRGVPELLGPCDCSVSATAKPELTLERIREELADIVGLRLNAETDKEIVRRLNAIGLFDFIAQAKPSGSDECPCVNCFSGQGQCEGKGPYPEGDPRNQNITVGAVEIGYCDDSSIWLLADGEGGSFRKDEFEAAIRKFIKDRI